MIFLKNQNDIVCSTQQIQITRDLPNYHKKNLKYFKKTPKLNFIAVKNQIQLSPEK